MFSKTSELAGIGFIAAGIGALLGTAAALIWIGLALMFIGGVTDDAAVGLAIKRGWGRLRLAYWRQMAREHAADPTASPPSPQPALRIDPEAQALADRLARARSERAKQGDRSPALRRFEYANGDDGDEEEEFIG